MLEDLGMALLSGSFGSGITFGLFMFVLKNFQIDIKSNTRSIGSLHKRISDVELNNKDEAAATKEESVCTSRQLDAVIYYLLAKDDGSDPQATRILEDAMKRRKNT
jgi:hypothetical protein